MKKLKDFLMANPLIPNKSEYADFHSLTPYFENHEIFDVSTRFKFGELPLIDEDFETIKTLISATVLKFAPYKWEKLFDTINFDYNPIWNVDGETKTTFSDEITDFTNGEKVREFDSAEKKSNTKYSAVPMDTNSEQETGKDESTSESFTDTTTDRTSTDTETKHSHNVTEKRGGNIGVTSTQNLISQERTVVDFSYLDVIFSDIVNAITIPYYE